MVHSFPGIMHISHSSISMIFAKFFNDALLLLHSVIFSGLVVAISVR